MAGDANIRWTARAAGSRTVTTHGLYLFEHTELTVRVDWPPDEVRDRWVERTLHYLGLDLAEHIVEGGRPLRAGDRMQCGWSTVRLADPALADGEQRDAALAVEECVSPFDPDDGYVPGLARTIHIMMAQAATVERHGLKGQMDPPHRSSMAMFCNRLIGEVATTGTLQAIRGPYDDSRSSGIWQIDCNDDSHAHDDSATQVIMHLGHIAKVFPPILQYLALPADSAFTIADGKVAIFRPGEDEYQLDPGDPLSWRP